MGEKVNLLTEIIANKNQKHGLLRYEREKITHLNLRLKEDSNKLHYEQIQIEEKVEQLVEIIDPEGIATSDCDLQRKV